MWISERALRCICRHLCLAACAWEWVNSTLALVLKCLYTLEHRRKRFLSGLQLVPDYLGPDMIILPSHTWPASGPMLNCCDHGLHIRLYLLPFALSLCCPTVIDLSLCPWHCSYLLIWHVVAWLLLTSACMSGAFLSTSSRLVHASDSCTRSNTICNTGTCATLHSHILYYHFQACRIGDATEAPSSAPGLNQVYDNYLSFFPGCLYKELFYPSNRVAPKITSNSCVLKVCSVVYRHFQQCRFSNLLSTSYDSD